MSHATTGMPSTSTSYTYTYTNTNKYTRLPRLIALALIAAVLIAACDSAPAAPTPAADAAGSSQSTAVNLIVAVKGDLNIKREGWNEYARALFGSPVRSGDLLKLDSSAEAQVVCADLKVVPLENGVSGVPCQVERPVLFYKGTQVNATRAMPSSGYPTLIAPRMTKLLNPRPVLRWTPMAGAWSYTVTVRGPNLEWHAQANGNEMPYPEDAPPLVPGSAYKLSIAAGDRSSDEESTPGLGFTILAAEDAQTVKEAEARIRELKLDAPATRLLIANLYANYDLVAEAADQLEALSKSSKEPAVMRLLGDLYLRIGLNYLAEEHYLEALDVSKQIDDVEGQASSHYVLGQMYEMMGNKDAAIQHLQSALARYEKLGDAATVKQINDRLADLKK